MDGKHKTHTKPNGKYGSEDPGRNASRNRGIEDFGARETTILEPGNGSCSKGFERMREGLVAPRRPLVVENSVTSDSLYLAGWPAGPFGKSSRCRSEWTSLRSTRGCTDNCACVVRAGCRVTERTGLVLLKLEDGRQAR